MKYLIVGGVAGGATVAARLRRLDETASIVLFEKGDYVSYANCGLPYYIGDVIRNRENLLLRTPEGFKERFNIEVRIRHEVVAIHPESHTVEVRDTESGSTYSEPYDTLILSPGAEPLRPPIPGIDSRRIFTLRTMNDMDAIKETVESVPLKQAVVVGGGFIGLEMAENLSEKGFSVSVVEMAAQVMAPLDYSMAAIVHQHLQDKKIGLVLEDGVTRFEETPDGVTVHLKSGRTLQAGLVVLSIGVKPDTRLAAEAGLAIGPTGGIAVNAYLQTSDPAVYALGDAIEILHPLTGKPARIPLAGPANKQGRIVANNIVRGNREEYPGTIGTSIAKVFDLTVAATGLNAKQLKAEEIPYLSSFTHAQSHAGYYPGALALSIKILFSPSDGKLLGTQVVGYEGVDKRIDVCAQIIQHKGTISDLMTFEHAYAPPYSSAKDPVNMAGFVADNMLSGTMKVKHWRDLDPSAQEFTLVDVRTDEENQMGTIPGAIHLPLEALRARMGEIPREKPVLFFCSVGLRGYQACLILSQHGFDNVYNLSGGYKTWSVATGTNSPLLFPVETPQTPQTPPMSPHSENEPVPSSPQTVVPHTIDACGLQCPGPVLQLKKQYEKLEPGEQMEILATDSGFARDVVSWSNMAGANLLQVTQDKGVIRARIEKRSAPEPTIASSQAVPSAVYDRKTLIVFSNDLDKAIAAFIIANGAIAAGKKVSLFFTFWGLSVIKKTEKVRVKKDFLGTLFSKMLPANSTKLGLSKMNMGGLGGPFMRKIMQRKQIYSLETLIQQAKENGVEMIACTMSMDVMGIAPEELMDGVTLGGVATYLERTETSTTNLFI